MKTGLIDNAAAGRSGGISPGPYGSIHPAAGPTPRGCRAGRAGEAAEPEDTQPLCGRRRAAKGGRLYFQRCLSLCLCAVWNVGTEPRIASPSGAGVGIRRGEVFQPSAGSEWAVKNAASTVPAAPPSCEGHREQNASVQFRVFSWVGLQAKISRSNSTRRAQKLAGFTWLLWSA